MHTDVLMCTRHKDIRVHLALVIKSDREGKIRLPIPRDDTRCAHKSKLQVKAVAMKLVTGSGRAMVIDCMVRNSTRRRPITINMEVAAATARVRTCMMIVVADTVLRPGV